ncbi:MAG: four helix bundle protein [Bacteroidetes bacterium QH_1_64_81]|nr:MAG: four helix bundle protein [Bacteroidetes bacterium QH_1_64_81]
MKNDSMTPEVLENRLVDFAVRIGKVADALPDTRLGQHIANQIVRSGTSPAPNYSEGCAAESRKDFAHKLSISLKELRETKTWLRIIRKADLLPAQRTEESVLTLSFRSQSVFFST